MPALLRGSLLGAGALLASACLFPGFDQLMCESDCGGSSATSSPTGAASQAGNGSGAGETAGAEPVGGGGIGGGGGAPGNPCADPLGRGADGVLVDTPGDFPLYCIDSVEVSWSRYLDFLNELTFMGDPEFESYRSRECQWVSRDVSEFEEFYGYPGIYTAEEDHDKPAAGMSWCDAQIHCRWAGKELCGDIDGASPEDPADSGRSQWVAACSHYGTKTFSYGADYDPGICLSVDCSNDFHSFTPAAPNACEGGLPGLYNMSGNVAELTNQCEAAGGPGYEDDLCTVRGGSCGLDEYTYCEFTQQVPRSARSNQNYQGFRCCWAPP